MTQCTDETAGDLTPTLTLRWYYLVEGLVRRYYMEHSGKPKCTGTQESENGNMRTAELTAELMTTNDR
ncbi:hypothetical protein OUZ56_001191 [Daphnia magna]|uniref:Uncharacterized protein n=1 Tax=Daphnia magna TaxID=35525 RepID=A0ABR0A1W4_9CRUS|nr:hypothetical protein OUZ56_001191 [Daphnia magna]